MEGGGRGPRGAPCNPSVILFTMCFLSAVIGWQMGHRRGAELATSAPICPDADGAASADASSDAPQVSVSVAELEAIYARDKAARAKVFEERSWRMMEGPFGPQWLWDSFGPAYPCIPRERIGDILDGGKWACGLSKLLSTEPCHVFSLGSHGQVDFEQAVLERWPHCRVFVYDHTLNDKERAAVLAVNGTELHELGIDSERRLAKPDYSEPKLFTSIPREMKKLGVDWYQLLKTDIEGFEWEVFDDFFERGDVLPFSQILVELHADRLPKAWGNRTAAFTHFFGQMEKQQYRVANTEINYQKVGWYQQYKTPVPIPGLAEYTFVKVNSRGQMITGPDLL